MKLGSKACAPDLAGIKKFSLNLEGNWVVQELQAISEIRMYSKFNFLRNLHNVFHCIATSSAQTCPSLHILINTPFSF